MVAKIQDVILPDEHYKFLIVRAKGFVTVDEALDEPQEGSDRSGLHSHTGQGPNVAPPPRHTCPSGVFWATHTAFCSNSLELAAG